MGYPLLVCHLTVQVPFPDFSKVGVQVFFLAPSVLSCDSVADYCVIVVGVIHFALRKLDLVNIDHILVVKLHFSFVPQLIEHVPHLVSLFLVVNMRKVSDYYNFDALDPSKLPLLLLSLDVP